MGKYVDPGNGKFRTLRASTFFADKSGLIRWTNRALGTEDCRMLVARPDGFGKTSAITMLEAYYSCGCESRELFEGLEAENLPSFDEPLNGYHVISMHMAELYEDARKDGQLGAFSRYVDKKVCGELAELYPEEVSGKKNDLASALGAIGSERDMGFVILIDDWDVMFRDEEARPEWKEDYLLFLGGLFKNSDISGFIDLAYVTGVFTLRDMDCESVLNNFLEYSLAEPDMPAEYFGFTESEVEDLCRKAHMPIRKIRDRCEVLQVGDGMAYCPAAVVKVLEEGV